MTVSNGAQRSGIGWYGYRRLHSLYKKKPASVRKLVKYRKSNQVRRSFWGHFDQNMGDPGGSGDKESACDAGDPGLIPGSGKIPGEGNGYLLQYSGLETSMDRGAWWEIGRAHV